MVHAFGSFSSAEAALAPTPCPDLATLADTPAAAELEAASEQPRGAAGLPQSAHLEQLACEAEEAAVAAAAEAGRAAGRAAAAAEAAVDRRVLAAVATVWLAFDGIPPEDEVQLS